MKLKKVIIHNFRGIIDASVDFKNYGLLVGANNSGKSTIIDCIRAFYEKDGFKFKNENDFPLKGNTDDESFVDITFSLNNDEYQSLKEEYRISDNQLKVRKYFKTNQKLSDGKTATGSIVGYKSDGSISNDSFYGAKNVQNGKFGNLIYIPAISKVDEHTKLNGPSALRDLVTNIMSDVLEESLAYKKFSENVQDFSQSILTLQTQDKRSLSNFENDLNILLAPWETKFNFNFSIPNTTDVIKSMLNWNLQDNNHDKTQGIDSFGSGLQRHLISSLIQLGSKYIPEKISKKEKDFAPSLNLVLFDEPEAFLHPPQQDDLARNLMKMSEAEDWQIVCATHSSNFISRKSSDIPAIIRLERKNGIMKIFQVDDKSWGDIVTSNQQMNLLAHKYKKIKDKMSVDDFTPEMESIKYFLWLNPYRSNIFFADKILLVEGPTETSLINKLIDDNRLNLQKGTYILDCLGKYNIHRFMNLLAKLGLEHSVIFDDDDNKDEHQELNELIKNSSDRNTTKSIKTIPKDLETFLNLPSPKGDHRKPQHVLYLYENGKIDKSKINDFCNLIDSCF